MEQIQIERRDLEKALAKLKKAEHEAEIDALAEAEASRREREAAAAHAKEIKAGLRAELRVLHQSLWRFPPAYFVPVHLCKLRPV